MLLCLRLLPWKFLQQHPSLKHLLQPTGQKAKIKAGTVETVWLLQHVIRWLECLLQTYLLWGQNVFPLLLLLQILFPKFFKTFLREMGHRYHTHCSPSPP